MSKTNKPLAQVLHYDLYGKREDKYKFLNENSLESIQWGELNIDEPNFFFVKKDFADSNEYKNGFKIDTLFLLNTTGIKTHDDDTLVSFLPFKNNNHTYCYRPFDVRYINYDLKEVVRHRYRVMKHIQNKSNYCLIIPRQAVTDKWNHVQISDTLVDNRIHYSNKGIPILCPLYLYPEAKTQLTLDQATRTPNLNLDIVKQIADKIGLIFTDEKEETAGTFAPIDLLDYIYAVLHSPAYREKYKEFLKIDFPRVPYPEKIESFWQLVKLGCELRQIHLLESPVVEKYITSYPVDGTNEVNSIKYESGKVRINAAQYFDNVPEIAWKFYIGGYQPAQKWLKDRKGRVLSFEDILHYQKIIVALTETDRLMREIDKTDITC